MRLRCFDASASACVCVCVCMHETKQNSTRRFGVLSNNAGDSWMSGKVMEMEEAVPRMPLLLLCTSRGSGM